MKFPVILSDPPWDYKTWGPNGRHRSPDRHYKVMQTQDIIDLKVSEVAEKHCILFLWALNPMLPQALEAMRSWGFAYKSKIEWVKFTKGGNPVTGTGYRARAATEPLLIGVKGNVPAPAPCDRKRGVILEEAEEAILCLRDPEHSRKPWDQYLYCEQYPGPYLEMFARPIPGHTFDRPSWTQIGNEITGRDIREDLSLLAGLPGAETVPALFDTTGQGQTLPNPCPQ